MPSITLTKLRQQHALADKIQRIGVEVPSCSRCEKRGLQCLVAPDTSRCGECVRSKQKCDVDGPSVADWENLEREERRLEEEERETLAKLLRLGTQKRSLRQRAREMMKRGLSSLDELDAVERQEKEAELAKVQATLLPAASDEIPLDPSFLHGSFWGGLDFDGGIPKASQGS